MDEFKEIINITEHPNGEAVIVLDEEFFKNKNKRERQKIIDSLCTLGRDKLMTDVSYVKREEMIKISKDKAHQNSVIVLRFLINIDGDFQLLTYFGGKMSKDSSIQNGLIHAAEVITLIQKDNK